MLLDFIKENRAELLARTQAKVRGRSAPRATEEEIGSGVPLFLTQFTELLAGTSKKSANPEIDTSATQRGNDMLRRGFTIAQVVHDYGDICQAVTELASDRQQRVSIEDFHILNLCLDNAIAAAVTEYSRQREQNVLGKEVERLGFLAHELRNLLSSATMAFQILKTGTVAIGGSTGAVLERSLTGLRELVDREPGKDRQRGARPDAGDFHEQAKGGPLAVSQKAEQHLRVFADHEMREQRHLLAERRQVVEAAHRHVDLVADAEVKIGAQRRADVDLRVHDADAVVLARRLAEQRDARLRVLRRARGRRAPGLVA